MLMPGMLNITLSHQYNDKTLFAGNFFILRDHILFKKSIMIFLGAARYRINYTEKVKGYCVNASDH